MRRFTFFCACLCVIAGQAQTTFQTAYGTNAQEFGPVIETTVQGGFAIAATTLEHDLDGNFLLIVTDAAGDTLWTREYECGAQRLADMKCTSDGGYILCGYSGDLTSPSTWDVVLIKTDAAGNLTWCKEYGLNTISNEFPEEIIQTGDGGFAVAGFAHMGSTPYLGFVLKVDAAGAMQWIKSYDLSVNAVMWTCITESQTGGLIVGGYSYDSGRPSMIAMKVDTASNTVWFHKYNGYTSFIPWSVLEQANGEIYLCGGAADDSTNARGFISKLSAMGAMQWTKIYDRNQIACSFTQMIWTSSGDLAITGRGTYPYYEGFVLGCDLAGTPSPAIAYLQDQSGYYSDITEAADGGFAISGFVDSVFSVVDTASVILIKTTASFNAQCGVSMYGMNDVLVPLTDSVQVPVEQSGNYTYLPNWVLYGGSNSMVICPLVGIAENQTQNLAAYPNPAQNYFVLEFSDHINGTVELFNAVGELVSTQIISGDRAVISLTEVPAGMYFYYTESEGKIIATGKVIKDGE